MRLRELPMKKPVGLCLLLFAGFLPTQPANAQTDFFNGKQIKIFVGSTDGGIIDRSARLPTRYIGKYIPGNSESIAQTVAAGGSMLAANAPEPTACGIITAADAQKLVGGPLDVKEFAKVPTANGPGTYDSICTYIAKGGNFENAVAASRLLDVTLHFLNSGDEMKTIYEGSIEQYRQMAEAPDAPFKNATITPIEGFGDKAFVLEAVTDPKTSYKSALMVFYKGRVGGSIGAWKKPESSLETTKAVAKHILSKLP
jgi:hypothetical protein